MVKKPRAARPPIADRSLDLCSSSHWVPVATCCSSRSRAATRLRVIPAAQHEPFLEAGLRRMTSNPSSFEKALADKLLNHKEYIVKHGQDMPETRDWKWKPAHE